MIEVRELKKTYDGVEALRGVSFSVRPGEIIGLLGPNGAGKTTLMKILTGFIQPDSGTAVIDGLDILSDTASIQQIIGYLPENAPLYPELTVQAQLRMMADLREIPAAERDQCLSEAVRAVGLEDRLTRPIATLSKGYRQRVGFAQAILHRPRLLILDEPTNGLDPAQIVEVRHLIRKLAARSTVILSTHILSEVEATCDRAVIIMAGDLKADAGLKELASGSDAAVTLALAPDGVEEVSRELAGIAGAAGVDSAGRDADGRISFTVRAERDRDLCPAIYQLAREKDWQLCELSRKTRSLETVFNELTRPAGGAK